jgi:hypothetical protein
MSSSSASNVALAMNAAFGNNSSAVVASTVAPVVETPAHPAVETPAFHDYLKQLGVAGLITLLVPLENMVPHRFQRELDHDHVHKLKAEIMENNESYTYPLKGCVDDWENLRGLAPYCMCPEGITVNVYDGGHRLAAAIKTGTVKVWPVEIVPTGKFPLCSS